MAHFPTWSHGISMWLRWHLDCIYCLAMGHLYSPWVWQPLLWQSSHLTGPGERCVLYIKLVSSCLSPGICFSVFPSSFQEKAHTEPLEVMHEYILITLTYMIHSRTFTTWLLLIRVQIILLVVDTVGHGEYLCAVSKRIASLSYVVMCANIGHSVVGSSATWTTRYSFQGSVAQFGTQCLRWQCSPFPQKWNSQQAHCTEGKS